MLNLSVMSCCISTATDDTIKSNSIFKFQVTLYQITVLVLSIHLRNSRIHLTVLAKIYRRVSGTTTHNRLDGQPRKKYIFHFTVAVKV